MQRNTGNMSKSSYDTDEDGVVDKAEGVRVVTDCPESPSLGEAVMLAAPITTTQAAAIHMLHEVANDLLLLL